MPFFASRNSFLLERNSKVLNVVYSIKAIYDGYEIVYTIVVERTEEDCVLLRIEMEDLVGPGR